MSHIQQILSDVIASNTKYDTVAENGWLTFIKDYSKFQLGVFVLSSPAKEATRGKQIEGNTAVCDNVIIVFLRVDPSNTFGQCQASAKTHLMSRTGCARGHL